MEAKQDLGNPMRFVLFDGRDAGPWQYFMYGLKYFFFLL
jgi:hypothetical protein